MQIFLLVIFGCLMTSDFLVKTLNLPNFLHFIPELCSGVVLLYVVVAGTRQRFRLVSPKYWVVFGAFALLIVCGIINNGTGSGTILSGMRFYLRAMPFFFLPAVMPFAEPQLKRQLQWLLALSFLQLPVAVYQRWNVLAEGRYTGDEVRGTLLDSGILSIFLICVVLVLTAMVARNRISRLQYAMISFLVLVPTVINETKGTLVMLPAALIFMLIMSAPAGKRLRYTGLATLGLAGFIAFFIPVYNMMEAHNPYQKERDITNYFTNPKQLSRYMSSDVTGIGTTKDVRRNDAIAVPFKYLMHDPARFAFGLGIGAASPSNIGKNFEGPYFRLFKNFEITSITFYELEFGVFGLLLIATLFWMVFLDTLAVSRLDTGLLGTLAAGWIGVIAMAALGVLYTILHEFASVTYLACYFTGLICARRVSLSHSSPKAASAAAASVPLRSAMHA
jgi:hypothetical protein